MIIMISIIIVIIIIIMNTQLPLRDGASAALPRPAPVAAEPAVATGAAAYIIFDYIIVCDSIAYYIILYYIIS